MSIRDFDFSSDVLNVTFDYHIIFITDCWQIRFPSSNDETV